MRANTAQAANSGWKQRPSRRSELRLLARCAGEETHLAKAVVQADGHGKAADLARFE